MALLRDRLFSAVALGHLAVDLLNGQRAVLLAFLSGQLALSNTALGLFSTVYVWAGSLTQPVFGYLADRYGPRWVASGGVLWMALFYSLAMVIPGRAALWLLVLASLGSAAFHPAGAMQATLSGRTYLNGKETTSTAYFFVFGQVGLFLGPLLGGQILASSGLSGTLGLAALTVPVGLYAAQQLRIPLIAPAILGNRPVDHRSGAETELSAKAARLLPLAAFGLLAAFQAWTQQNMVTFLPKYLSDLGQSAGVYGSIAALFMGGSALGIAFGGHLADRYGKRRVTMLALGLSSIPLYLISLVGWSPWLYFLVPLAGGLTGGTHSILVVLAQRMIPGGMALASGLILGFMFSSGALGTLLSGMLADTWGFPLLFQMTALIALTAGGLAYWLKKS